MVCEMVSLFPFHLPPVNHEDPRLDGHIFSRVKVNFKDVKTLEIKD